MTALLLGLAALAFGGGLVIGWLVVVSAKDFITAIKQRDGGSIFWGIATLAVIVGGILLVAGIVEMSVAARIA